MGRRVLVTGGLGFIGSHLVSRLLARGYQVIVVDNRSTGRVVNLGPLKDARGLDIVYQDVSSVLDFDVAEIYHLACPASPEWYQRDPIGTMTTCVYGAINVL